MATRHSRNGVFFWYLRMFLLVSFIPSGVMGISVWSSMRNALMSEMIYAQRAAMNQVAFMLEQYVVEMETLTRQLLWDPGIHTMIALMHKNNGVLEKVQGVNRLNSSCTPSPFVGRIIVVNNGIILSNEGIMLSQEEISIRMLISQYKGNKYIYRSDIMKDHIYYITRFSVVLKNDLYLICEIPRGFFMQLVNTLPHGDSVKTVILEGKDNVIFYNDDGLLKLDFLDWEKQWMKVKYNGTGYFQYIYRVNHMNLGIATLVPQEVISVPLNQILFILLSYQVLAVLFGIGLSMFFAYRNYKPIRNMLLSSGFQAGFPASSGWNGLKALSSVYEKTIKDNLQLRNQVEQQSIYTARHFMTNILMGRYVENINIADMALQFNIFFRNPLFRIIVIQMHSFTNSGVELNGKDNERIYEIIGQFFHQCGQYTLVIEPGCTVAILNYIREDLSDEALGYSANQITAVRFK
jgi:hypothetical protein